MRVSTKSTDPYTVTASITLEKSELLSYAHQAAQALTEQVTVEGFRKGKAPQDKAIAQLSPDLIRQEALSLALSDSFSKAADQEHWDVMRTTDLKIIANTPEQLEYSIAVALWPKVTLPELSSVAIARNAVTVTDAEIGEAFDTLRNMRATFLDKVGPAAEGDRVEVDFDASVAGAAVQGGSSRNHPLIIGGKNFMPGFEDALIGLAASQKKSFSLTAPKDYYESALAGKTVDFTVTVNRVQTVLKPAADDAFAKSLGRFQTLDELTDNMRAGIAREKEEKESQRARLAVLDALIAGGTVPAPEKLVEQELHDMVHRFSDDLKGRGMELSLYLARMKKTEDDLRTDWKKEAERQVRIMLVLRQVAVAEHIEITPQEVDGALEQTVAELMRTGQLPQDQIDPERMRSAIAQRMLTDKTLQFLEDRCVQAA